jgi:hypothetical protein
MSGDRGPAKDVRSKESRQAQPLRPRPLTLINKEFVNSAQRWDRTQTRPEST